MKTMLKLTFAGALMCLLLTGAWAQDESSPYVVTDGEGHMAHVMPTIGKQAEMLPPAGALSYHGGPIMLSNVNIYAIFWVPSKLQNGGSTGLSSTYEAVVKKFAADYPAHGIANNSTQYYQVKSGVTTYFNNAGSFAGYYVDTDPYPASGCSDSATPGNCITDAQLQTEIAHVLSVKGWNSGFNKIYLVFTSTGEGSCFNSSSSSCAYTQYCAYHSYYGNSSSPVIYGNEPYADPRYCYAGGQHDPNGDIPSDAAVNIASHETTEAATDPELNAWWDTSNGEEIGDLCAWMFGATTWDGGLANQMWNGHYYDLQMEYDNHTSTCVQVGP